MNSRQRMLQALRGEAPEVYPVVPCYLHRYLNRFVRQKYGELYLSKMGGRSSYSMSWDEDVCFWAKAISNSYGIFSSPPDWISVHSMPPRSSVEGAEMRVVGGRLYCVRKDGSWTNVVTGEQVKTSSSKEGRNSDDLLSRMPMVPADKLWEEGWLDVAVALARRHGEEYFICGYGVSPFTGCFSLLGFHRLMTAIYKEEELLRSMMDRNLERSIEWLKYHKRAGIDGIWIQEYYTSGDLISPRTYRDSIFPYDEAYIKQIRALGLIPILNYMGDVMPRLEMLSQLDVVALAVEESKKGFKIEIGKVRETLGWNICLFGNIDVVSVMRDGTEDDIKNEVFRQIKVAGERGAFVISTGSPLTLDTEPKKVDYMVQAARSYRRAHAREV